MVTLTINSFKGPLAVSWSDESDFRHWISRQRTKSGWMSGYSFKEFAIDYQNTIREWWHIREGLGVFDLPPKAKIVDIGSGIGVLDLFASEYNKDSTFYLIDIEADKLMDQATNYHFYNSWQPLHDAIKTSKFNSDRFNLLSPDQEFPKDVDLIMSNFSWCWHYSLDVYLEQVLKSLKIGGKLFLTLRLDEKEDIVSIISDKLNSKPIYVPAMYINQIPTEKDKIRSSNKDVYGLQILWIRN